jgi:hypothetical protein
MKIALGVALVLSIPAAADYIAMDYDLHTCPGGWAYSLFEFTPNGALSDYSDGYGSTSYSWLHSGSSDVWVWPPADSVVLDVEQYLELSCVSGGAIAYVSYRIDGGQWINLSTTYANCTITEPIHFSIPVTPPCTIGIQFSSLAGGSGYPWMGSGDVYWLLENLTLTVCGDVYGLERDTWGSLKALFD